MKKMIAVTAMLLLVTGCSPPKDEDNDLTRMRKSLESSEIKKVNAEYYMGTDVSVKEVDPQYFSELKTALLGIKAEKVNDEDVEDVVGSSLSLIISLEDGTIIQFVNAASVYIYIENNPYKIEGESIRKLDVWSTKIFK